MPDGVDQGLDRTRIRPPVGGEANAPATEELLFEHLRHQRAARSIEAHLGARLQLLAGMHQRIALHGTVAAGGGQRQQQALDRSAARHAAAEQTRREDAGVVDDEQIAAAKEASDVGDACVLDLARRTMQDQQARRSTRRRLLRDQFFGKLEIEVVYAHADQCPVASFR